ncbi:nucleotidyltransferase domain-containing protein [Oscillatoria sp. CS-180]|uniref:nucleotidyltransferase family protein n=1 Tax=Oscillatoria sp. CS-180 TaxID=3021720 RepID=UPI00232FA5B4|nr:nucleotidyltransferase domain-containing protein [Oscillatoria sp. CS-180]MDB9527032.1 nucleotidyltransferase domain-containing protein [Oscillatoria sp. CS-180]
METRSSETLNRANILAQLQALKPDLNKRYAVSQIGVFGSVARDDIGIESDIDVVVHMQPDILKRACLKAELETVFSCKVDVVRYWHGMNTYLKTRIDREVIYV